MSETLELSKKDKLAESLQTLKAYDMPAVKVAQSHLATLELPHFKAEDWRYTNIAHLSKTDWKVNPTENAVDTAAWIPKDHDGPVLVFVNGFYRADLSETIANNSVFVGSLEEAAAQVPEQLKKAFGKIANTKEHVFAAMNTAHTTGGAFISVAKSMAYLQSVHLLHIIEGEDVIAQPHHVILAGDNSELKVTATFVSNGESKSFNNAVLEVAVGAEANVYIDQLQAESLSANTILSEYVTQGRNSTFSITTNTLNGGFVRNGLYIDVDGEHCETNLTGVYVTKDRQLVDNHTIVDHKVPNCESNELYKGLLDGSSTGVFNGKVFVRQDAQKTNAFQSNGNILLSDMATINSKPELEIYADDVKCSHGSTTGQLDEDAVFYLRARGLSHDSARKLMVGAFVADALDLIHNKGIRKNVEDLLESRFDWKF